MSKEKKTNEADALETALRILSRRDHTRSELRRKLLNRKYSKAAIEKAIEVCDRYRYLNDERAARLQLEQLLRRGYGRRYIAMVLERQGVEQDIIHALLEEKVFLEKEFSSGQKALEKKRRQLEKETDQRKKTAKCYRYLLSKGFPPDLVRVLLETEVFDF